jgi:hypothetical protein
MAEEAIKAYLEVIREDGLNPPPQQSTPPEPKASTTYSAGGASLNSSGKMRLVASPNIERACSV